RHHAALDPQRRPGAARRARAGRRRRRGRLALHRRHHPDAAGRRDLHRDAAQGVHRGARRRGRRVRGGAARGPLPRGPRGRDGGARRTSGGVGAAAGRRRDRAHRRGPAAPALDAARHQPPPRSRRARLRAGARRDVPRRRAAPGHGVHDRAGPVLQVRRPGGARGAARDRGADRGRRARDLRRRREPLGGPPPTSRGRRGVDGVAHAGVSEQATDARRRGRLARRPLAPALAVGAGVAALYALWSWRQWQRFETPSWDLGIFTQLFRAYGELRAPVVPIKGPGFMLLGDHWHPLLAVLTPAWWVHPSGLTLLVVQALLVGASAAVVTGCAARHLGHWPGVGVGVAYGLSWGLQSAVASQFHEVALALPFLAA